MSYAYFIGCQIPARFNNYDVSTRNVAKALGIDLVDLEGAGCCGLSIRAFSFETWLAMGARIMAMADEKGQELVTVCNGCYGALVEARDILEENNKLREKINEMLSAEGLEYQGKTSVKHFIQILYHDYGLENIKAAVKQRFDRFNVAVHYGCHILRPSKNTKFDNSENPKILDELVEATGAKSIYWPLKLWCCGAPTLAIDVNLGMKLAGIKLKNAKESGAHCIVMVCPICGTQFDLQQSVIAETLGEEYNLPALFYPQILGLALGLQPTDVGLELNRMPANSILQFLK
jgi:heterodisulfide reductase subunit B